MRHPRDSLPRPVQSHVIPARPVLRESGGAGIRLKNEPRASFPRKRESTFFRTGVDPRPSTSSGQAFSRRDECRGSHHHGFAARPMDTQDGLNRT
jgi:hypothetical protein